MSCNLKQRFGHIVIIYFETAVLPPRKRKSSCGVVEGQDARLADKYATLGALPVLDLHMEACRVGRKGKRTRKKEKQQPISGSRQLLPPALGREYCKPQSCSWKLRSQWRLTKNLTTGVRRGRGSK
jgi:hypothetical protein